MSIINALKKRWMYRRGRQVKIIQLDGCQTTIHKQIDEGIIIRYEKRRGLFVNFPDMDVPAILVKFSNNKECWYSTISRNLFDRGDYLEYQA